MKLKYCDKKSNSGSCSNLATHKCELKFEQITKPVYRCDEHKFSGTVHGKVNQNTVEPFDQQKELSEVNSFLESLIGKTIKSKRHTAKGLEVRYIKPNGGAMCFQPITKQWKFVYHHQVILE